MGDVARADQRVGCGKRPLRRDACERERARVVGQRRRPLESGASTIQPSTVSSPCSVDERAQQRIVREPAQEPRRADHLLRAVDATARRGSAPRAPRARAARRTARPGGYDGASSSRRRRGALRRREPVEAGEPATARSTRAGRSAACRRGSRRRTETTSRARVERVQPLGRRREARADDASPSGVLVRLVRVHRARVVAQLVGHTRGPDVPARRARAAKAAVPSIELEAAVHRARSARPAPWRRLSSQPLRSRRLLDVREELLDRRVIAVARRLRRAAAASAAGARSRTASPGNVVGQAVPVALGAHLASAGSPPPAAARRPPGRPRCRRRRSRRARARRARSDLVRREAGEPGPPTIATRHYFTEPASSPCTK